jgi:hypothetical protein
MTLGPRLITRIALFAGLIYVFSWATSYLPNINLIFFIVFSAGFLWGAAAGAMVGTIGMGLWTFLNPYGPAALPVMLAQIGGAAVSGIVGAVIARGRWQEASSWSLTARLCVSAALCTIAFYLPVNSVDAWLFQPFWPRFVTSGVWTLISLGSNLLIFPLLFPVTRLLYRREKLMS